MDRRAFLKKAGGTLLVLPFGTFLVHCASDDGKTTENNPVQPDNAPPDAQPRMENGDIVYTSNKISRHSHGFPVPVDAFSTLPEEGVSGDTTESQGHNHALSITANALAMAANGQGVKIQTATTNGHSHTFTIIKI